MYREMFLLLLSNKLFMLNDLIFVDWEDNCEKEYSRMIAEAVHVDRQNVVKLFRLVKLSSRTCVIKKRRRISVVEQGSCAYTQARTDTTRTHTNTRKHTRKHTFFSIRHTHNLWQVSHTVLF